MTKEEFADIQKDDRVSRYVFGRGMIYGTVKAKRDNFIGIIWDGDSGLVAATASWASFQKEPKC